MAEAQVKKPVAIIRGRIPLAIVFLIRFVEKTEESTKNLAEKYATTVGKIDDIRKNRNFAYVDADVRFTQAQIDEATNYIKQHENEDDAADVTELLNKLELATAEQAEAFANVKRKAGAQPRTDEAGNVIEGGGGNRREPSEKAKSKKAKKEDAAAEEILGAEASDAPADPTAEELLDL